MNGIPHSLKLQHYWNLTIKLFSVISRTLVRGGLTPLQRCSRCILQPQPTGQEKGEGTVDHHIVTKLLKKFGPGCKNLDDQVKSGKLKNVNSKTVFAAMIADPVIDIRQESGELAIFVLSVTFTTFAKAYIAASRYQNMAKLLTHPSTLYR